MLVGVIAAAGLVAACGGGPSAEDLASVDYSPTSTDEWTVSTPADHGLDPDAVAEVYWRADQLVSIHSLLVLKDGERSLRSTGVWVGRTTSRTCSR